MSATKLLITLSAAGTVTVPISSALQSLDSGQQASQQTGFSSVDVSVRNIFRGGGFYDSVSTWYPSSAIMSITSE
jgi:hypothetical protein